MQPGRPGAIALATGCLYAPSRAARRDCTTLLGLGPVLLQRPCENGRAATVPQHRLLDRNARATVMGDTEHRRRANCATGSDYWPCLRGEG